MKGQWGNMPTAFSDVRIIDETGSVANAGLVQVRTDQGFGSVCGMNEAAADTVCREMGLSHGHVVEKSCRAFGGADICGAAGSPVAMQNLQCVGNERNVQQCTWSEPDATCQDRSKDAVVWCSSGEPVSAESGAVRLLGPDGQQSFNGEGRLEVFVKGEWAPVSSQGFSEGSATVACKQMGFHGVDPLATKASPKNLSGQSSDEHIPPCVAFSCSGKENGVLNCPHEVGSESFCVRDAGVNIKCVGGGDASGLPSKQPAPILASASASPLLAAIGPVPLPRDRRKHTKEAFRKFL